MVSKSVETDIVIELSFLSGSQIGEIYLIDSPGAFRFGRDSECEIHLSDPDVSRFHGQFVWDGEVITVEDFRSRNGVFLNGKKRIGKNSARDYSQLDNRVGGRTNRFAS